ncbi:MAG: ComF family protein [Gemmatimonadetes bacterium]|nr:ComF family protein [Gemmatimonadota bacterium]
MRHSRVDWAESPGAAFARWLLPSECLTCQDTIADPAQPLICGVCAARWAGLPEPACARCQHPRLLDLDCRLCAEWPPEFIAARSAVRLDERVREVAHAFKYGGWRRLAPLMARRMAPHLDQLGPGDLVPIPTSRRRRWRRGYNQAEVLAAALAELTGRRVRSSVLTRRSGDSSQVGRTPQERLANLGGAFRGERVMGPVILVDDVFTTGATLVSAATALRTAGVERIAAVTFARAEPPLGAATRRRDTTP